MWTLTLGEDDYFDAPIFGDKNEKDNGIIPRQRASRGNMSGQRLKAPAAAPCLAQRWRSLQ